MMKLIKRLRTHVGYYRLTKRFLKFDLPRLSKKEKEEIRRTWPGINIYETDFISARVYKKIHGFSPYYLSPCWYNEMREYFNPSEQLYALTNKALCDVYFPGLKFPEVYVRCLNGHFFDKEMNYLSQHEAIRILKEQETFVIKPSIGTNQGFGVKKVDVQDNTNFDDMFNELGKNFIAQEVVSQAPEIRRLNPSSLNCFRVTTMYFNGKFDFSTALKVGKEGSFRDNWNSAYWINVEKDGRLSRYGYDYYVNPVEKTDNGIKFQGIIMPAYNKMIGHLEKMHKKLFPNCGVIGWDVTIDENYDVLVIETNLVDPGTNIEQFVCGDFFKPFREDMLFYINKKK